MYRFEFRDCSNCILSTSLVLQEEPYSRKIMWCFCHSTSTPQTCIVYNIALSHKWSQNPSQNNCTMGISLWSSHRCYWKNTKGKPCNALEITGHSKGLHQLSLQQFFNRCKSETPHAWECEEASSLCWHVHIDLAVPDISLLPFLHSARKTFLHSCWHMDPPRPLANGHIGNSTRQFVSLLPLGIHSPQKREENQYMKTCQTCSAYPHC